MSPGKAVVRQKKIISIVNDRCRCTTEVFGSEQSRIRTRVTPYFLVARRQCGMRASGVRARKDQRGEALWPVPGPARKVTGHEQTTVIRRLARPRNWTWDARTWSKLIVGETHRMHRVAGGLAVRRGHGITGMLTFGLRRGWHGRRALGRRWRLARGRGGRRLSLRGWGESGWFVRKDRLCGHQSGGRYEDRVLL
ncbi:hypothetical protein B0H12DRAFT_19087 [Mycena haematopus]|nr:hypothetical protein B0H12DRAFT_19087 [Mycena haematopus]